ncbi:MAG: MOSC domain-containing protein [Gemmataceae bacterium]|nr:MOSC domain-containing protein [Gemmataceae bacterium]
MTGRVESIVYAPEAGDPKPAGHFARVPSDRVALTAGAGIDGDRKAVGGGRQLNVMLAEVMAELAAEGFKAGPGELGEQLVLSGIDRAALTRGARVRLGGAAVIEVDIPRTGCARFEAIQGKPRSAAAGRLGVMARVVSGGPVAVGDAVEVVPG